MAYEAVRGPLSLGTTVLIEYTNTMSNDENYFFGKDEIEHNATFEALNSMLNARSSEVEAIEHMRTLSTNVQDPTGMKLHMINSHQFGVDNTKYADESLHYEVPRIRHKLKMMGNSDRYPEMDHEDIVAWHNHEHTAGDSADIHEAENIGEEHRHL